MGAKTGVGGNRGQTPISLASPASDGTVIDSGNLSLRLSADGRTLAGRIWLNSAQADQAAELTRLRR